MDKRKELPTGLKPPKVVTVVVEATKDSRNTYNVNGMFTRLENVLYSSITYPCDYGFIPKTMWEDGKPLRAMILTEYPTFPGCLVDAVPIGLLKLSVNGVRKDKLLAVPLNDSEYKEIRDIKEVSEHNLKETEEFFKNYKKPKTNIIKIIGWTDTKDALRAVTHAMKIYNIKNE